jgi:VWFA-related protein
MGLLAIAMPAGAQAPESKAPTAPTLKVYARETIVDVTVTDAKGNPVHGLTKDDFTVKEDGKPQPIRSFEEFGDNPDADSYVPPNLPPNTYSDVQPPPASSAVNILLLDGMNTAPSDSTDPTQVGSAYALQTRVKQGAQKFLAAMPSGTRGAIFGLSRNLRILQGITSDPALLSAAVDTMEINMDGRASSSPSWCAQQNARNRATLEALNQIATAFAAIKGKKNLIWFSGGVPTITDPAVNAMPANLITVPYSPSRPPPPPPGAGTTGCLDIQTQPLIKTYALLASAQVAVFPIDAHGLGSPIDNPNGPGAYDPSQQPLYGIANAQDQLSLESVAEATGGAAYYNNNDLGSLAAQAVDKGANYYTLSYIPPGQKFDWGHHSIKIALNPDTTKPGLHLVYRQTYDAVDPATIRPATSLTLAAPLPSAGPIDMRLAMGRAMPASSDLHFTVYVESSPAPPETAAQPILGTLDPAIKAKLKGAPLTRYSFLYTIPTRQLAFAIAPDGSRNGALEVDIAVYDADAKLVTGLSQIIKMPLSDTAYQRFILSPSRFFQLIDLPPGQLFVRIGVLDRTSNKVGTLEIPVTVAKK